MKNATSKLSLLTAFLCLVFTVQGQVTNPYQSSFEVDLTGDTDPQLILKREVTTPGGTFPNPTPPMTYYYHWDIDAGSSGLQLRSVS